MKNLILFHTYLLVIFPILSIYSTGFKNFSIADALLMLDLIFLFLIDKSSKRMYIEKKFTSFLLFGIYILFTYIFQEYIGTSVSILSTFRYLSYIIVLIIGLKFFDFKKGIRVIGLLTIIISLYVIIQYMFFRILDVTLPWKLSFFEVIDNSFVLKQQSVYYHQSYRPTGIFYEPTHYAQFCLIYISYIIFEDKILIKTKWFQIIIIIIGIICSGSAAGLLMVIGLVFFYYIKCILNGKFNKEVFFISIFIILAGFVVVKNPNLSKIYKKLIATDGNLISLSVGYRFNSVVEIFSNERSIFYLFFGTGRGSANSYFTSIFYVIFCHGIIGFLLFINIFIKTNIYCKSNFQKKTILIIFLMSIGSEMVINFGIMTYFVFLLSYNKDK